MGGWAGGRAGGRRWQGGGASAVAGVASPSTHRHVRAFDGDLVGLGAVHLRGRGRWRGAPEGPGGPARPNRRTTAGTPTRRVRRCLSAEAAGPTNHSRLLTGFHTTSMAPFTPRALTSGRSVGARPEHARRASTCARAAPTHASSSSAAAAQRLGETMLAAAVVLGCPAAQQMRMQSGARSSRGCLGRRASGASRWAGRRRAVAQPSGVLAGDVRSGDRASDAIRSKHTGCRVQGSWPAAGGGAQLTAARLPASSPSLALGSDGSGSGQARAVARTSGRGRQRLEAGQMISRAAPSAQHAARRATAA